MGRGNRLRKKASAEASVVVTPRMSLVAVCWSSAVVSSRFRASSSVKRRTFSIAMTA
jgi:hypothetical protein